MSTNLADIRSGKCHRGGFLVEVEGIGVGSSSSVIVPSYIFGVTHDVIRLMDSTSTQPVQVYLPYITDYSREPREHGGYRSFVLLFPEIRSSGAKPRVSGSVRGKCVYKRERDESGMDAYRVAVVRISTSSASVARRVQPPRPPLDPAALPSRANQP